MSGFARGRRPSATRSDEAAGSEDGNRFAAAPASGHEAARGGTSAPAAENCQPTSRRHLAPAEEDGPVHRRLIRATLPRPEGQAPERKEPDFTIRQPGHAGSAVGKTAVGHQRADARVQGRRDGRRGSADRGRSGRAAASRRRFWAGSAAGRQSLGRHHGSGCHAATGRARAADAADASAAGSVSDFSGKHGLIVGVANKRSIAWAIAQATATPRRAPRPHLPGPLRRAR